MSDVQLATELTEKCVSHPSVGYAWSFRGPELTGIKATLQNENLWQKFAEQGTEMIITKVGRRMFPTLQVTMSGLEPDALYFLLMDMVLVVDGRLKFNGAQWVRAVGDDGDRHTPSFSRCYFHPDSPSTGAYWMTRPVSMQRAKITNCTTAEVNNSLELMSMHKYQPRIHVVKASDVMALAWSPRATFTFPVTQFVAVTAYQNKGITSMKIDHNPFAKGFRDKDTQRVKRERAKTLALSEASPPASVKRSRSLQSTCSDSGVSSLGSPSPCASEQSSVDPLQEPKPTLTLPWEFFALSAARTAVRMMNPYPHVYNPYQNMWKYPFLLPPPAPFLYHLPTITPPPDVTPPVTTSH